MLKISAVQCLVCKDLVFSRTLHDYRSCSCGKVAIDGGFEYTKIVGDREHFNSLVLNGDALLKSILYYDYAYGNRNIPSDKIDGWQGIWHICKSSNRAYFNNLLIEEELIYERGIRMEM